MKNTEKKPDSIFKLMKAFWIYDAVVAILLFFEPIALTTGSDFGWWYLFIIYFGLLLIGAPVLFGIWFGYQIGKKPNVSFGKKIIMSILIFMINYFTLWIPIITSKPWTCLLITVLPAIGLTALFLISSIVTSAFYV